jgi:polysaccharide pyruvyl transferase WcaK-like protein
MTIFYLQAPRNHGSAIGRKCENLRRTVLSSSEKLRQAVDRLISLLSMISQMDLTVVSRYHLCKRVS